MATITIQVGDQSHQVTVDDSFKELTPDQQQAEVEHIAAQIGANKTSGGGAAAPSMVEKAADAIGVDDTMLAPAVGTAIGATTGAALGPATGEVVDFIANKLAGKAAAPGIAKPTGAPEGVINWYEQESGHPYAGGKTKESAYAKGQRAAGEPVESRGSKIPIRKGNLGITNQIEPTKPTLAQKTAANIINAEKVGTPGMTRRMAGMGVAGGELGNLKEELSKGNYGRAALSGLGALSGLASQSKIKPVRAVGTGLSAIVPTIQMMLPDEEEDKSNINKKAGGRIQHYDVGSKVKKLEPQVAQGAKKYSDIIQNYIGKILHPTIVDTTKLDLPAGKMAGPEASNLQNISPLHAAEDWVFANDSMSAAKRLHNVNQRNNGNVIFTGLLGSPYQLKTNRSVFGDLTDEFYKAVAAGKLDPELLAKYQEALKNSQYKTNKGMVTTFPEQFDIRDRAALEENSKLFHQREALANIMGGKGPTGTKLSGKKGQIFDWEGVLNASRDPNTIGAPTQSIGTRLFTLNDRPPEYRPDLHNAFDYAVFGKDLGESFAPVPKEAGFPSAIEAIRQGNIAKGKKPDVTSMHIARNILLQPVTEDYVKNVQAAGFASGGGVQHFKEAGKVGLLKEGAKHAFDLLGITPQSLEAWRAANKKPFKQQQNPLVAQAVDAYRRGDINQNEMIDVVRKQLPIRPLTGLPSKHTDAEIAQALDSNKIAKGIVGLNAEIPEGMRIGNRLDIPAYEGYGVYTTTHHTPQGNVYGHTGHLKDVDFLSDPAYAMRVAMGTKPQALTPGGAERGLGKAPFAVMEGSNIVTDPEEVRRAIEFYKGAPEWKQIGMNPYRHSQFYNKETMNPVWNAEEVLQSGPYVIAKRPSETTWEDTRLAIDKDNPFGIKFAKGGLANLKKKK